jgi:hypothetical protein
MTLYNAAESVGGTNAVAADAWQNSKNVLLEENRLLSDRMLRMTDGIDLEFQGHICDRHASIAGNSHSNTACESAMRKSRNKDTDNFLCHGMH